jgi:hypothetical protein
MSVRRFLKTIVNKTETERKPYKSLEEWEKENKEWETKHPVLHWFECRYYTILRFIDRIRDIPRNIKHFIQRGKRGWSSGDWWRFDYYIAEIIVGCLKKMKYEGNGIPTWGDNKPEEQAVKEWHDILDNMIYTFETAMKIADGDLEYVPTYVKDKERRRKITKEVCKKINEKYPEYPIRVLTEEESKKFEKGFDLFKEWFFALWD